MMLRIRLQGFKNLTSNFSMYAGACADVVIERQAYASMAG